MPKKCIRILRALSTCLNTLINIGYLKFIQIYQTWYHLYKKHIQTLSQPLSNPKQIWKCIKHHQITWTLSLYLNTTLPTSTYINIHHNQNITKPNTIHTKCRYQLKQLSRHLNIANVQNHLNTYSNHIKRLIRTFANKTTQTSSKMHHQKKWDMYQTHNTTWNTTRTYAMPLQPLRTQMNQTCVKLNRQYMQSQSNSYNLYMHRYCCVCVCAWTGFVCIYGLIYLLQTYKYTWTQICIHLFTHKWTIWLWICMCLCCCACQHAHLCVLICMHMQFWTSINVYACKYANLCLYKFRCASAFAYIHI